MSHLAEVTFEHADDRQRLRRALGCFATGVTVVTTRDGDGALRGLTANSFSSVSLDPPLVLWSLAQRSPSLAAFAAAGHFAVNVLGAGDATISRHFASHHADKFIGIAHTDGLAGCPLLTAAIAVFECRTETVLPQGDHTIFIGRVSRATWRDGEPLIFSNGDYYARRALAASV